MISRKPVPVAAPLVASTGPAWRREVLEHGKGHSVRYFWNPYFLKHAFDAEPVFVQRSRKAPAEQPLVLADILAFDEQSLVIRAHLVLSDKRRKRYRLEMELVSSIPVNKRARITIVWAGRLYGANVVNGHATISDLPHITSAHARSNVPESKFRFELDLEDLPRRKKG